MVFNKNTIFFCTFSCFFSTTPCHAHFSSVHHPFYLGVSVGYGSTTWEGLVPKDENQNLAISMSTPVEVTEGGAMVSALAGFEVNSYFAIETAYMRFPDATVSFNESSLFSFDNDGLLSFETKTEALSLMGKVMVGIGHTPARLFSSAGIANVHREDALIDNWRISPAFGVGLNYRFRDRLMGEIAGNYIAGYGESQLSPADAYFPFLYAVSFRLMYMFG